MICGCGILFFYLDKTINEYKVILIREKRGYYNDMGGSRDIMKLINKLLLEKLKKKAEA